MMVNLDILDDNIKPLDPLFQAVSYLWNTSSQLTSLRIHLPKVYEEIKY